MIAWGEALIVHRRAEVTCAGVRGHRPRVSVCAQKFPNEFIETDRLGNRQFDCAVQRFLDRDLGHDGGDIIRHDGLYQRWRQPNRLPLGCRLGDAAYELEELRGADDRVWNRRGLDQILLASFARK